MTKKKSEGPFKLRLPGNFRMSLGFANWLIGVRGSGLGCFAPLPSQLLRSSTAPSLCGPINTSEMRCLTMPIGQPMGRPYCWPVPW